MNDELASIFVDLGIREEAPDRELPHLLWSWVAMRSPRPDGLATGEERPLLNRIEDALAKTVAESVGGRFVGRIMTQGRLQLYFYAASPVGFREAVTKALAAFPGYRQELGDQLDGEWSHYLETLMPTDEQQRQMADRDVVESLQKHGDKLTEPRRIDHWIGFPRTTKPDDFLRAAAALGFSIEERAAHPDDEESETMMVQIFRQDRADLSSISQVTCLLDRLAQEHGGDYDGWESVVVRDPPKAPS